MEYRGPLAIACWLLLLLLLLLLPPHSHQGQALRQIPSTQRIQDPPAMHLSNGPGQEPVSIMTFNLTKITKTSSSFEFRTWDPEGVIFYGDTNPKDDWFVLGLRDGRPEIQLHNPWAQLTVGAGPRLDDGRWHQVEVKIVGDSVLLRVDGEEVLRLRQVSGTLVKKTQPIMRIAIGGLLFPVSSLRLPVTASRAGTLTKAALRPQEDHLPPPARHSPASCRALGLLSGTGNPAGSRLWPPSCPWDPRKPFLAQPPSPKSKGGAVFWVWARARSVPGLGTPSSAEAGCVQRGLEPGAEEGDPCFASCGPGLPPQSLGPPARASFPGGFARRDLFCLLLLGQPLGTRPETRHGPGPEQKPGHLDSQLSPELRQWHWHHPLNSHQRTPFEELFSFLVPVSAKTHVVGNPDSQVPGILWISGGEGSRDTDFMTDSGNERGSQREKPWAAVSCRGLLCAAMSSRWPV
ncbi:sex hormone-binding globulin isoform X1 [Rhinolophus sinicus]|uniref:sex hormone-binding globulin isoform X1 n=1 Tax=Rhinolophus sinicus TaxID=89399 RepID=UPI003D798502